LVGEIVVRLLDIFWLLLVAPSFCLWIRRRPDLTRGRFVVAITCFLVLLFPVISASDDLRAAAQEVEESGPSKPNLKQISGVKHLSHTASGPAFFHPELNRSRLDQTEHSECLDNQQHLLTRSLDAFSGRAPPSPRR
jgi:hypothetical protein